MEIRVQDGLPYIRASLSYRGQQITLDKVLLDTGSMGTIFSADKMDTIDLLPESDDRIRQIRGVGGKEFVFTKRINGLTVGELQVGNFEIEVGAMEYGFEIDGIVGMDFLLQTGAVIDLTQMEIR
jgi:hypothetical protein